MSTKKRHGDDAIAHMNVRALASMLQDARSIEAMISAQLAGCTSYRPFVVFEGITRRISALQRSIDRAERIQRARARVFSTTQKEHSGTVQAPRR